MPIRKGDGTALAPKNFAEVRKGDGTILWSAGTEGAVPASAIHQWAYDEGTGTTAADSIGTADGTLNGGVGWVADAGWYGGNAITNPGADGDYVDLTTLGTFGSAVASSKHAIAFTIQTTATNANTMLGHRDDALDHSGTNDQFYQIGDPYGDATALFHIRIIDSGGTELRFDSHSDVFGDGTKHRVVCNIDPANGFMHVYDSTSNVRGTWVSRGNVSLGDFVNALYAGALNNKGTAVNAIPGEMDDIVFTDSLMTSEDIRADHADQPWTPDRVDSTVITHKSWSNLSGSGAWSGRPVMEKLPNGNWLMLYRDATDHSSDDSTWHARFSTDEGATWTADDTLPDGTAVSGFPYSASSVTGNPSDAIVFEAPNGDILAQFALRSKTNGTRHGTSQLRSTDNGATWTDEGQLAFANHTNDDELLSGQDYIIHPATGDIWISLLVDPGADMTSPYSSAVAKSTDNGATWSYISEIGSGVNETGIEYVATDTMVAIIRDDDNSIVHRSTSTDNGTTWSALTDISSQFAGGFHRPRMYTNGYLKGGGNYTEGPLWLIGRVWRGTDDEDIVVTWSTDDGQTWAEPYVLEHSADNGYSDILRRSDGTYYQASYSGTKSSAELVDYVWRS